MGEGDVVVGANERDVGRHTEPLQEWKLRGGDIVGHCIDNQRGGCPRP